MPDDDQSHDAAQHAARVAALRHEHAGYVAAGRDDRAEQVATALTHLGEKIDTPRRARPRHGKTDT
ncbi:MAG: hypothetical protein L0H84_23415 [Pseudonocardia sp.]|nr:hypothetical protein [Pseudonocardia sp.]